MRRPRFLSLAFVLVMAAARWRRPKSLEKIDDIAVGILHRRRVVWPPDVVGLLEGRIDEGGRAWRLLDNVQRDQPPFLLKIAADF
jgi:hypothetical protein